MNTRSALIAAITLTLAASTAYADAHPRKHLRDPGVNARQHVQGDRVRQGVRSGELTRTETKDLNQQRRAIRQKERAYKSDGKLDKTERKELHQDLNRTSKNIHQEKHDAERR